jgi:hypothetical protein
MGVATTHEGVGGLMQMAEFADIDFVFDVFDVLPGAGGVEDEVDIGKLRHLHQAAHPFVGGYRHRFND